MFGEFLENGALTTSDAGVNFVVLDAFKAEIKTYRDMEKDIAQLPIEVDVGWIRLDTQQAKDRQAKGLSIIPHFQDDA